MENILMYRKFLLNRVTTSKNIIEHLEDAIAKDEEFSKYCFHKIMIHNWVEDEINLYNIVSEYFNTSFVPVDYTSNNGVCSFYTSSLSLVMKIIKLDFMFPYARSMYNMDILINDKMSQDLFDKGETIEGIVSCIVSNRFNEEMELNLSDFCNDPEFAKRKIRFYKFLLLANFKILMLRMGRDTKVLNLSNNKLSEAPIHILNFFTKGELKGLNLSNNNIQSLQKEFRVHSKIEKLWLEGNPLCDQLDLGTYIKECINIFPKLSKLDGIKINQHGIIYPFFKQFSITCDGKTKFVVENFIIRYFTRYDSMQRNTVQMFYTMRGVLTMSLNVPDEEAKRIVPHYFEHCRNSVEPYQDYYPEEGRKYLGWKSIITLLSQLPATAHDINSFTIDVLHHDSKSFVLVVNGVYKEKYKSQLNYIHFTRSFVFSIVIKNSNYSYRITNEIFTISLLESEQGEKHFKAPTKFCHRPQLLNPSDSDKDIMCHILMNYTSLKKNEAQRRLNELGWDIKNTLRVFVNDMKSGKILNNMMESENKCLDISTCELD